MFPPVTILNSRIVEDDARRAGERGARLLEARAAKAVADPIGAITIRHAKPDDATDLARLAEVDLSEVPALPVLLAEVNGRLRAALSLSSGFRVADSSHGAGAILELLAIRAYQLRGARPPRRPRRWLLLPDARP